jgi:hypothetical protein
VISDWQYRQLNIELSALGYRTAEPAEFAPEQPAAVAALISQLESRQGLTIADLARITGLPEREFSELYLCPTGDHVQG